MKLTLKLILAGILNLTLAQSAFAEAAHGILRVVKGDVQIKSGQSGQLTRARLGGQVAAKDVIVTGKDARAKVVMNDNNELNISPDSQVEIQNYEFDPSQGKKEVLLNVLYGKVRAKVEQHYDGKTSKFEVKTPAAVAGVRGTDFMTSFDRTTQSSQVVTFRGAVEFGLPGPNGTIRNSVSVTPGTVASSTAGQRPAPPAPVPQDQLRKMDNDSRVESSTSASASTGNHGANTRAPASTTAAVASPATPSAPITTTASAGGSMMLPEDLPSSSNVASPVTLPPPPPPPPPAPTMPTCATCNSVIQGGTGKANLTVHLTH